MASLWETNFFWLDVRSSRYQQCATCGNGSRWGSCVEGEIFGHVRSLWLALLAIRNTAFYWMLTTSEG